MTSAPSTSRKFIQVNSKIQLDCGATATTPCAGKRSRHLVCAPLAVRRLAGAKSSKVEAYLHFEGYTTADDSCAWYSISSNKVRYVMKEKPKLCQILLDLRSELDREFQGDNSSQVDSLSSLPGSPSSTIQLPSSSTSPTPTMTEPQPTMGVQQQPAQQNQPPRPQQPQQPQP